MNVNLIAKTGGVGELAGLSIGEFLAYVARVSNPSNQMNHETASKLLSYCLRNQYWIASTYFCKKFPRYPITFLGVNYESICNPS